MPINLDTLNRLYGMSLTSFEAQKFLASLAEPKDVCVTSEDVVVSKVGRELYNKFYRGYTRKQWGLDPSELDASVAGRVPVRTNRDDRYFTDTFQAMPLNGYTRMFEKMLSHPNIKVGCSTPTTAKIDGSTSPYKARSIYTGPCRYLSSTIASASYPTGRSNSSLRTFSDTRERTNQTGTVNFPND